MLVLRKKIKDYIDGAKAYLSQNYEDNGSHVQYFTPFDSFDVYEHVRNEKDSYNADAVRTALKDERSSSSQTVLKTIRKSIDRSFVDTMIEIIDRNHWKDSDVYKAAQIDRRLFSKIVSDRSYKPAKDTCIALGLALHLTKTEAQDFLSRAGYTLSHSDMRDVVIEYFFSERIYKLIDINIVLDRLDLKLIGR